MERNTHRNNRWPTLGKYARSSRPRHAPSEPQGTATAPRRWQARETDGERERRPLWRRDDARPLRHSPTDDHQRKRGPAGCVVVNKLVAEGWPAGGGASDEMSRSTVGHHWRSPRTDTQQAAPQPGYNVQSLSHKHNTTAATITYRIARRPLSAWPERIPSIRREGRSPVYFAARLSAPYRTAPTEARRSVLRDGLCELVHLGARKVLEPIRR